MLFVALLRGPHCPRYRWFGYEGRFGIQKPKSTAVEPEGTSSGEPDHDYVGQQHSVRADELQCVEEVRKVPGSGKEERFVVTEKEILQAV